MRDLRIQHMKVGDNYISSARIVTRTEIENFCSATGMKLPVFASNEWVKASPEHQALGIKSCVAPGQFAQAIFLGNLITDGLLDDVIVQLKTDNVKYLAPVYAYDMLRTEIEITGNRVSKSGTQVIIDYNWAVKNQHDIVVEQGVNTCMFKNK